MTRVALLHFCVFVTSVIFCCSIILWHWKVFKNNSIALACPFEMMIHFWCRYFGWRCDKSRDAWVCRCIYCTLLMPPCHHHTALLATVDVNTALVVAELKCERVINSRNCTRGFFLTALLMLYSYRHVVINYLRLCKFVV